EDASHIFALLHCSLPIGNRTFAHPIPLIGNSATIPLLCDFIHLTPHPSHTVILLFMEPFLCYVSNPDESTLRRVVFIQTSRHQSVGVTADRIQVYNLNLDAPSYLASIHSTAYNIIDRFPPRVADVFSAIHMSEYSEE
ncbi:hypothetical protein PENTCL1PPCAC_3632, partial [Pristionchus entomophagus]